MENNNSRKVKKNMTFIIGLVLFILGFFIIIGSILFKGNISRLFGDVTNAIDALAIECDKNELDINEATNCSLKVNTGSYSINAIQGLLSSNSNLLIENVKKNSIWDFGTDGTPDIGYSSSSDHNGTVEIVTFTITANNSGTGVITMGKDASNTLIMTSSDFEDIPLNSFSKNITITEPEPEKSDNAYLSNLNVSSGSLIPSFSKETYLYVISLPEGSTEITINAEPEDNKANVEGTGTKSLIVGTNPFEIVVTAEDGIHSNTYVVNITVEAPLSSDNKLKSLTIDKGTLTPAFDPDVTQYNVIIPYTEEGLTISAEANDANSTITGEGYITVDEGESKTKSIVVTAQNGSELSYSVTVTREQRPKSTNSNLSSITLSSSDSVMTPQFNKDITDYTITFNNLDSYSTYISAMLEDDKATASTENIDNWNSSTKRGTIIVSDLPFVAKIIVTAEDGVTTKTYNLTVRKRDKHTDNTLKSLSISTGTLTPAFNPSVTTYNATVPNSVNSITLNAEVNDELATLTGTGVKSLSKGLNEFEIIVTAENTNTLAYKINITREDDITPDPIDPEIDKSTNAFLSSLSIENETLEPQFNKNVFDYTVKTDSDKIKINATKEDNKATIEGTGIKSTSSIIHKVKVTAEDGITINIYTIRVVKNKKEDDITCKLESSIYNINNDELLINNVDSNHSDEIIKSNLKSSCGEITVNKDTVILKIGETKIFYKIVRIVYPKTGNRVISYSLIIGTLLSIIGITLMIASKFKKES